MNIVYHRFGSIRSHVKCCQVEISSNILRTVSVHISFDGIWWKIILCSSVMLSCLWLDALHS